MVVGQMGKSRSVSNGPMSNRYRHVQMTRIEIPNGQMSNGQMSNGQISNGQMSNGQMSYKQIFIGNCQKNH